MVRVHWLLNDAMKALALDRIDAVEFAGNDIHRQHVPGSAAARCGSTAARRAWTVEGHTLPQYGFYLRAGETEAAIELRGGARVEWSRSPDRRYEGGRLTMASGKVMQLPDEVTGRIDCRTTQSAAIRNAAISTSLRTRSTPSLMAGTFHVLP